MNHEKSVNIDIFDWDRQSKLLRANAACFVDFVDGDNLGVQLRDVPSYIIVNGRTRTIEFVIDSWSETVFIYKPRNHEIDLWVVLDRDRP